MQPNANLVGKNLLLHEVGITVHEVHEVCRRLRQPKERDKILKETISHREGCLGNIFGTNIGFVIARAEINFKEHLGSC
jgi:hypothetical protein